MALLLLDALDETAIGETEDARRTAYTRVFDAITQLATRYSKAYMLVSARIASYHQGARLTAFTEFEVLALHDEVIFKFVEYWFRQDPATSTELKTQLQRNLRIQTLAANPLLLSLIVQLYERQRRLPDRRADLYKQCTEMLLTKWDKSRNVQRYSALTTEHTRQVLRRVAWHFHLSGRRYFQDDEVIDVIVQVLSQPNPRSLLYKQRDKSRMVLEEICANNGLLQEIADGWYGFLHLTFQEYFAAADIYERYQQEGDPAIITAFLKEHLHDPFWSEVILLLLGKLKQKIVTDLLRQILEGEMKSYRSKYTDIQQQDLFFISSCLAEEIVVETDLAEVIVSRLSRIVKKSLFPTQQKEALDHLCTIALMRQYSNIGRRALAALTRDVMPNLYMQKAAAVALYTSSPIGSGERQQSILILLGLVQDPNLSIEQVIDIAKSLYESGSSVLEERQQAILILLDLAQRPNLESSQTIDVAEVLNKWEPSLSEKQKQQARDLLLPRLQRDITEMKQATILLEQPIAEEVFRKAEETIQEFTRAKQEYIQKLLHRTQDPDLSIEQAIDVAERINREAFQDQRPDVQQQATQMLLRFMQDPNLSVEQAIHLTKNLYQISSREPEGRQQATQMLLRFMQDPNLSVEQAIHLAESLYQISSRESEGRQQATQMLFYLVNDQRLTLDQRLQVATVPITCHGHVSYQDGAQSVRMVRDMLLGEEARHYLEERWRSVMFDKPETADIPYLVELIKQELLPTEARNEMYSWLRQMVPLFDKIDSLNKEQPYTTK